MQKHKIQVAELTNKYQEEIDELKSNKISHSDIDIEELQMELKVELERSFLKQMEDVRHDHQITMTELENSLQDKHILEISEINSASREQVI